MKYPGDTKIVANSPWLLDNHEIEYDKDFENSETSDLDKLLKELYFNIRRINGEYYNRSS
jgi:hypothetical protein